MTLKKCPLMTLVMCRQMTTNRREIILLSEFLNTITTSFHSTVNNKKAANKQLEVDNYHSRNSVAY